MYSKIKMPQFQKLYFHTRRREVAGIYFFEQELPRRDGLPHPPHDL